MVCPGEKRLAEEEEARNKHLAKENRQRVKDRAKELADAKDLAGDLKEKEQKATQRHYEIIKELKNECQKLYTDSTCLKSRFQADRRRAVYPLRKSTL
jgi:hypothetical protein